MPSRSLNIIVLLLALVRCSALVGVSRKKQSDDSDLTAAAVDRGRSRPAVAASRPATNRLRKWMDTPATKSAMLVVAGGCSGAIAKSITAPLERAKLLSQAGATSNFLKVMRDVVAAEGWQGLWRGNSANVIRVIPNKGILLMCSDMYKSGVMSALPAAGSTAVSTIAGGLAGLTAVLSTYPLELVRTRMAYRICDPISCEAYATVWSTLRSVVRETGPIGLYAGVGMTLIGSLPFEGIKFGLYDAIKTWVPRDADGRISPVWTLLNGAVSGAVAHAATYPLDTIRRRMQISGATGASTYTSALQCMRTVRDPMLSSPCRASIS